VGVFRYSKEEGTAAARYSDQVPEAVKRQRRRALMQVQAEISAAANRRLVGSEQTVLVCGEDEHGRLYGRLPTQAPEIDGQVYLRGDTDMGQIVRARIIRASTYDLQAEVSEVGQRIHTYPLTQAGNTSTFPPPLQERHHA